MAKHCRKNGRKKICLAAFLRVSLASHVLVVVTFGQNLATFLDASTHLYKRLCPSVGWSVRWLVRQPLFLNCESGWKELCYHPGGDGEGGEGRRRKRWTHRCSSRTFSIPESSPTACCSPTFFPATSFMIFLMNLHFFLLHLLFLLIIISSVPLRLFYFSWELKKPGIFPRINCHLSFKVAYM